MVREGVEVGRRKDVKGIFASHLDELVRKGCLGWNENDARRWEIPFACFLEFNCEDKSSEKIDLDLDLHNLTGELS